MPTMCGHLEISGYKEITVLGNLCVIVFNENTNDLLVVPLTGSETNMKTRALRCFLNSTCLSCINLILLPKQNLPVLSTCLSGP